LFEEGIAILMIQNQENLPGISYSEIHLRRDKQEPASTVITYFDFGSVGHSLRVTVDPVPSKYKFDCLSVFSSGFVPSQF
jgi:hypothetical protein